MPKSYVFKGSKEVTKEQILDHMGFFAQKLGPAVEVIASRRDGLSSKRIAWFLFPASECEFVLNSVLEELQKDRWHAPIDQRASRCTSTTLSIVASLLGLCVPGSGARIMAFICGPSTEVASSHAVGYASRDQYYGAKASLNVWTPRVASPTEFSLPQIWVISGSFNGDLGTIEAGWQFGGEIVNTRPYGTHTTTQMGSGRFVYEGFRRASYFQNLQVIDWDNNLIPLWSLRLTADHSNCYNVHRGSNRVWGSYFYYGGPGKSLMIRFPWARQLQVQENL